MSCKRLSIILLCLVPMVVKAQVFNPLDYGLREATSDSARYNVLLATHEAAVAAEGSISYSGIDSINIAFPKGAKSLPLAKNNDFAGAVVTVTNNQSDIVLYLMYRGAQNIDISAEVIESGDFSSVVIELICCDINQFNDTLIYIVTFSSKIFQFLKKIFYVIKSAPINQDRHSSPSRER